MKSKKRKIDIKFRIMLVVLSVIILGSLVFLFYHTNEKVHFLRKYYPESKETFTFEYVIRNGDTILQGKAIIYNERGIKTVESNFVNNELKGERIHYYDNGKIESVEYIVDNKRKAEVLWNYPNGKIQKYAFFSNYKEPIFLISYDEKGPKTYEGSTIESIFHGKLSNKKQQFEEESKYFKVGDTLLHSYLIANIPDAKRSFKIENIGFENTKVKRSITPKEPTTIEVKEILTTKGKNTIKAIVKYEFKDNIMPTINDTLSFEIEVN